MALSHYWTPKQIERLPAHIEPGPKRLLETISKPEIVVLAASLGYLFIPTLTHPRQGGGDF